MQLNPVSLDIIAEAREEAHAVLATLMARLAQGEHVVRLGVDMEGQRPVSAVLPVTVEGADGCDDLVGVESKYFDNFAFLLMCGLAQTLCSGVMYLRSTRADGRATVREAGPGVALRGPLPAPLARPGRGRAHADGDPVPCRTQLPSPADQPREGSAADRASWAGSAADRPPPCGRHSRSPFRFPRARSDPGHPLRGEKRNKGGKLILCCAAPRALPFMVGRFFMKGTVWV